MDAKKPSVTKPRSPRAASAQPAKSATPAAPAKLAKVAPKGAVKENSAAVVSSTSVAKASKPKAVRASFTVPKDEYATLAELKKTCQSKGIEVKKSQLLRAGIALLRDLDSAKLTKLIAALPATKSAPGKKAK
jgi:hypothetical protein